MSRTKDKGELPNNINDVFCCREHLQQTYSDSDFYKSSAINDLRNIK